MNREDVAKDLAVENNEVLRGRLEQAEALLKRAAEICTFNTPDEIVVLDIEAFLASQQGEQVKHPEQAEGAQGEREALQNPSCSMCGGNGYFCEFSTVETCWCCLPEPESEETVEALTGRIESLKAGITHMKQQRDAAVARAALAQPYPTRNAHTCPRSDCGSNSKQEWCPACGAALQ